MPLPVALPTGLIQAAAVQAPVVMVSQRDWFDWLSGGLQVVVLLLVIVAMIALILLMLSIRKEVHELNKAVKRFTSETRPLISGATLFLTDAREVVAMVRTDVERVSAAGSAIGERLTDAVDLTASRLDQVNAVLDVLQAELERTAIGTVSAIRGVRIGAQTLAQSFGRRGRDDEFDVDDDVDDDDGPAIASRSFTSGDGFEEDEDFVDEADLDYDDEARPA